jgi:hypothetical protein
MLLHRGRLPEPGRIPSGSYGGRDMKSPAKPKRPKNTKAGRKSAPAEMNEATGDDFEREGMGIAPKE